MILNDVSFPGALENVEYPFSAITLRSTQTRSSSIYYSFMFNLNRTI